ncbi:hypothetical protein SO802_013758 [Lithocarpus litseifolius]|uniref:F-box associated beta-propeller type 1 domain-containing protein n=1 Tax=Lithocarpus litseifolius TaxID=425828 RepID=A0AAW2D8M6_9ROSI
MAGHQCCSNPPTLDPTAGAGHVEQLCGLSTYVTGSPNAKHAIILISDIFVYNGFMLEAKSLDLFIVGSGTPVILGSCNNLLLVHCCSYLYLWNPSSVSPPGSPNSNYYIFESFTISTYSFRTNTLKEIDDNEFPYNFDSDTQGVTLNGAPHWVLRREYDREVNSKSLTMVLVYFDPAKEHFYELPLPCMLDKHSEFELGVLGGCLSLSYCYHNGSHFETWVMKKYGVEESWEKLFVIPYFEEHLRPVFHQKQ